jgi:hypothetical protein
VIAVVKSLSISASEDEWQHHAVDVAIETAREHFHEEPGGIPPGTPIGRLNNAEWGRLVASILFGWINTRAQQATLENLDTERTIRETAIEPNPWEIGMIVAVLPALAESCPNINWSKPLGAWRKEELAGFLLTAMRLIERARIARDASDMSVTRQSSANEIATQSQKGRISF